MRYLTLNPSFNRYFQDPFNDPWSSEAVNPGYDLEETVDHYLLEMDMPGVPKNEIKMEVHDNQLTISGERRQKDKTGRQYSKFHQAFSLPAGVDADKVEAEYEDGVLKVYLPKAQSAKPRQVQIGTNPGLFSKLLGSSKKSEDPAA